MITDNNDKIMTAKTMIITITATKITKFNSNNIITKTITILTTILTTAMTTDNKSS